VNRLFKYIMQPLLVVKFMSKQVLYDFRDEFSIPQALGKVNGTRCSHRGTRTVVDTGSKLSISSGKLTFASGATVAKWNDPGLSIDSITRTAGLLLKASVNTSTADKRFLTGFNNNPTADAIASYKASIYFRGDDTTLNVYSNIIRVPVSVYSADTDYPILIALRGAGAFYFVKLSGIWKLLWIDNSENTATLYPMISSSTSTLTSDYLRIPSERWLPIPLVSDGMSNASVSDGLGHLEQTGLGSGGSGLSYTDDGTWSVAAGKAVNTPTEGSDLITNGTFDADSDWTKTSGNVTIAGGVAVFTNVSASSDGIYQACTTAGTYYKVTYDITNWAGTGFAKMRYPNYGQSRNGNGSYLDVVRSSFGRFQFQWDAGGVLTFNLDNVVVKPLTLSSLFSSLSLSTQDVVASADLTVVAGTQAGMVICLDSAANPQNFLHPYHNGTNAILEKCVAGTYTTLISAAATYAANAPIVVHKDGTKVRLYYNNALIGTEQTVSDAGIINNKLHGKFSTYVGNTIDNLHIEARGNQGQYANIDRW